MIKVLEILEATVGGTRRHLISLVEGIDKASFHLELAAPASRQGSIDDTGFIQDVNELGLTLHVVDMKRQISFVSDIKALLRLFFLIRREKYHLVHVHSSKAGFLGRIAAWLNGVPVIYTPNGLYFLDSNQTLKRAFYLGLEHIAGWITNKVIAVSVSEMQELSIHKVVPESKIAIIPNAISIEQMSIRNSALEVKKALDIPDSSFVVGTVSRHIPQKDPLALIQIFAGIHQLLPEVFFIWCGEGDMRSEVEHLAEKLGVIDNVRFLGYRTDVIDIMNTFDVFVLCSVFEGLPYTLLEAMALGKAVVVTSVVGSRDVVVDSKSGLLVEPGDNKIVHMVQAIASLLNDEAKRQAFGYYGLELVKSKYSLKEMITKTEALYYALALHR